MENITKLYDGLELWYFVNSTTAIGDYRRIGTDARGDLAAYDAAGSHRASGEYVLKQLGEAYLQTPTRPVPSTEPIPVDAIDPSGRIAPHPAEPVRRMPGGSPVFPPTDSAEREASPVVSGCLDYFPLALLAIARYSLWGNNKHNSGEPLHWSRRKSTDHANKIGRHLIERGTIDPDSGFSHSVGMAWRALALLQKEEEMRIAGYDRDAEVGK